MDAQLRDKMITGLRECLADGEDPDEPLVVLGEEMYSFRQVLEEIEADTELAEQLVAELQKVTAGP